MGYTKGKNFKIGKYCIIDDDVIFGDNVEVGNYVEIGSGCRIGDGTKIKSKSEIRQNTIIGKNCYIDSSVKTSGDCKIGDEVTLRYDTIIARDVVVEDKAFLAPQVMTEYSDYKREKHPGTVIGSSCFIGTNSTIRANIKICPGSVIGRKSDVRKDIKEPGIYIHKNDGLIKIKEIENLSNLDRPRGWPCVVCGRMLNERNSPCPVSVACNDCRIKNNDKSSCEKED